jgi:hypothetical protein
MAIIKLSQLILEDKRSRQFRRPLFMNALTRGKFKSAYNQYLEGNVIYRGLRGSATYPYWVVNPVKSYRVSRNTNNFYTGLLDKLPAWKDYPKRSRSIICSSNPAYCESYGNVVVVLPVNGAKIGVCPEEDIWASFRGTLHNRLGIDSLGDFNSFFVDALYTINDTLGRLARELTEDSYDLFMKRMDAEVPPYVLSNSIKKTLNREWHMAPARKISTDLLENQTAGWEDYFNKLLDPKTNKFQIQTIETFHVDYVHEVWTDATSLLISDHHAKELLLSPSGIKIPGDPNLDIKI